MRRAMQTGTKDLEALSVCVVGGGNAAQAMAALFPHRGIACDVFAPYGEEAKGIRNGLEEQGHIRAEFASHNDPAGTVRGRPNRVSEHPDEVIAQADVIILPLPSFAYVPVFEQIGPHLEPGTLVGVTPGQGGVDWAAREVLRGRLESITLFSVMPMPFNCRIAEFGKRVEVQTFKRRYRVASLPGSHERRAEEVAGRLFGPARGCGHFLASALYPINAVIHPARLYTLCRDWSPGQVLSENPLFYEDMTAEAVAWMDRVSTEVIAVADALRESGLAGLHVPHIREFLMHDIYEDWTTDLCRFFRENPAYKGFRCPFRAVGGGWEPDFSNRYFTEDVPYGLCVYKGLAELAGVPVPGIEEILTWAQTHMGKEYIKDHSVEARDLGETGCPQRYGIRSVEALRDFYERSEAGGTTN